MPRDGPGPGGARLPPVQTRAAGVRPSRSLLGPAPRFGLESPHSRAWMVASDRSARRATSPGVENGRSARTRSQRSISPSVISGIKRSKNGVSAPTESESRTRANALSTWAWHSSTVIHAGPSREAARFRSANPAVPARRRNLLDTRRCRSRSTLGILPARSFRPVRERYGTPQVGSLQPPIPRPRPRLLRRDEGPSEPHRSVGRHDTTPMSAGRIYSLRRATTGSTRMARKAGTSVASVAIANTSTASMPNVSGSVGSTSKSIPRMNRDK